MKQDGIESRLKKLAEFEGLPWPVISLYLDARPNANGRDQFEPWLRKEIAARQRSFDAASDAAKSFNADVERIHQWLKDDLSASANGAAIFACSGADGFFEGMQFEAPVEQSELYVQDQPQLYPLCRLLDQFPRYAVVIADTNSARILVFGLNRFETAESLRNRKSSRAAAGGWSQARFQRRIDNFRKQHAKEVVDSLERVLRDEKINQLILAGDQEVVVPLLLEEMPAQMKAMVVDVLRMDATTGDRALMERALEAFRAEDARQDQDRVARLLGEYRSGGLAVGGVVDTLTALEKGQVEELIVPASPGVLETPDEALAVTAEPAGVDPTENQTKAQLIADALVTKAQQTGAKVSFIENSDLLTGIGGCGALLRYKM